MADKFKAPTRARVADRPEEKRACRRVVSGLCTGSGQGGGLQGYPAVIDACYTWNISYCLY